MYKCSSFLNLIAVLSFCKIGSGLEIGKIYNISDLDGYDRVFDGIGAISGGGATSRLLVNYPQKYRDEILDYLFKPNFAASLQILKVEIGGDSQTTDGTESSHMHTEDEEPNFQRGYEWWLMKEAKLRNPNIKLACLPWAWPGWLGGEDNTPYSNETKAANYVVTWILGAASEHDLNIDYVGIWNERNYDSDYIKTLRNVLDSKGLQHVEIVAADGWVYSPLPVSINNDPELDEAVSIIGSHYLGTVSDPLAVNTGKPLWASEDYSTYNDDVGAGCWARILNRNYVHGHMTSTIAWNLIASYYDNLPYNRTSLMTANEPWSGHYIVPNTIWVTAHTTQFAQPGWSYLKTVGSLEQGGTYVALTDRKGSLTIIIETMTHKNSICIRPPTPKYEVEEQTVTFLLTGSFSKITKLYSWYTRLGDSTSEDQVFARKVIAVNNGHMAVSMLPDTVVTLTTVETGMKGSFGLIPPSRPFPFPYSDNFDESSFSEADNFADQSGVFEIFVNESATDGHEKTMRQVVPTRPITWCEDSESPITIIGDYAWTDVNVTVDVKLEDAEGVFVAARVDRGGCDARFAKGAFLWLKNDGTLHLTKELLRTNGTELVALLQDPPSGEEWSTLSLVIKNTTISAYVDNKLIFMESMSGLPTNGWAGFGVESYAYAQFDNFSVS